jgi:polysaccharide export outer membrane protein
MKTRNLIFTLILAVFFSVSNTMSQVVEDNYIIRRGDMLTVNVMSHPEFSVENIIVLPDGNIQFPGLGSIPTAGMSVKNFTKIVNDNVSRFVQNPIVTVFISNLPNQIINVIGFVNKPGQIVMFEKMTVLDAISKAGGIKLLKKCKKVVIIRSNQTYEIVNVKDLFSDDYSLRTKVKMLEVGDTVYVVEPKEINWAKLSFFTSMAYIILSIIRLI